MSRRPILPDDVREKLKPYLEEAKRAVRTGSGAETVAAHRALWAEVPTPYSDWDLQAMVSTTVLRMIRVEEWAEGAKYLPIKVEQYGAQDADVRGDDAVITYHLDPPAGLQKLKALLNDVGTSAFLAYPEYVKVARGGTLQPPAPEIPATELPEDLAEQIDKLSEEGTDALDEENWDQALTKFEQALALVPEPKRFWDSSTWLYTSIGDAHLGAGRWPEAGDNYALATLGPTGLQNPYLHLRLGQADYETGNYDAAANNLIAAYMSEGEQIFAHEPPKYLNFLRQRGLINQPTTSTPQE